MAESLPHPAPVPNESPTDARLREQLLDRRRRLVALEGGAGHRADVHDLLHQVDAALGRLGTDRWGICTACHVPLDNERLLADPLTRVCIECLDAAEARALERDLELAASIQAALLPARVVRRDGWEIHHRYQPRGPVSGDHCDVLPPALPDDPLHVIVGDVSGKGVAASILMSQLHAIFRSLVPLRLDLGELVERANRLFGTSNLPSSYATLVVARLHRDGGLELCNAGHSAPLLQSGGETRPLPATGLPLGLFCTSRYEVHRTAVDPGALLLLYTDGLSESRPPAGDEHFGVDRIAAALREGRTAEEAIDACLARVEAFRAGARAGDDLTLMAVQRL